MHWLIDGHNLIGQLPGVQLSDPNDEEKLLEYLRRYRARTGHQLTVVFDAGQSYQPAQTKKRGGITVQFVAHGQSADKAILRRLRRVRNPQGTTVVSSDRALQQAAERAGIRWVTAQAFSQQLVELFAGPEPVDDAGSQAELELSPDEVDEWLKLFKRPKS